jgi:hypothetical protein
MARLFPLPEKAAALGRLSVHWPAVAAAGLACTLVIVSLIACLPARAERTPAEDLAELPTASLPGIPLPSTPDPVPEPIVVSLVPESPPPPPAFAPAEAKPFRVAAASESAPPEQTAQPEEVVAAPPALEPAANPVPPPAPPPDDWRLGTAVTFVSNPEVAAEQAKKDKKLLFLLHVSGNFEASCFT